MKNKTFVCNNRLYKRVTKSHALGMLKEDKPFRPSVCLVAFLKDGYRIMVNFEEKFHDEYETYLYAYRDSKPWEEILEKSFNSVYNEYRYWLKSYSDVDSIGFYLNYDFSDL